MHTELLPCSAQAPDPDVIAQAAKVIKKGGLVVYPTDTFYGLGGDPRNVKTLERIFQVKGRSRSSPLPLIIDQMASLKEWVSHIPPVSRRLMDLFWPGPLTIVFPCASGVPQILTAGTGKIGLRWPKAPVATAIVNKAGIAIISTSANLSGKGGILNPKGLLKDLDGLVDIILDSGELPPSQGSTVVDATFEPVKIIRQGDIPRERLYE